MIHALPAPIRGNTHARITMLRSAPDSGIVLHFLVGAFDGEAFAADALIPELQRQLAKPEAVEVRERAAAAGAPVTAGEQEYRLADLLAHLDAAGWAG